jgi:hypothetical protein
LCQENDEVLKVARDGQEYEQFVYDKLRQLFVDSTVTLNDKIQGRQSGLLREIDISIKTTVNDHRILYIVSCKDRSKRPADIVVLGEFSSVIKDVGTAKGYLICTSGFARTNHQYARTLGIELLTVEDINSDRWKANIQIPFICIRKLNNYTLIGEIIGNEELVKKNQDQELVIHFDIDSMVTRDDGKTSTTLKDYFEAWVAETGPAIDEGVDLDLLRPNLRINVADVWAECAELTINLTTEKKFYLKYLTPREYSHVRDHLKDATLPLRISLSGDSQLDDSFVEIDSGDVPISPVVSVKFEEWTLIEQALGRPKS